MSSITLGSDYMIMQQIDYLLLRAKLTLPQKYIFQIKFTIWKKR